MPGVRDIKIRFSGDASGLSKAAKEGEAATSRFSDRTQKVAKGALLGVAAFAGAAVAALKGGVQGLQEGEEAEAKFADALSRSSRGIQNQAEALKANAEEIQKNTRFTYEAALGASTFLAAQDGVKRAVGAGVVSMKDATNVSLDLATVMGVDATAAAGVLSKALAAPEKATGALRKAGVTLSAAEQEKVKALVKSGDVAGAQGLIMDKLKKKTEGAAEAAGQTTAGQMERAQNAFGEVQEQLAVGLIPVITDLMQWLLKVTAWAQDNPGKVKLVVIILGGLAAVIGTVSLAITAWSAITRTATAVQAAWNAVMAMNPIGLVVIAVVALIAIIVVIATKTTWFQDLWKAAWGAIKGAISGVFNWVKSNWPLLLAILTGPIGLAVLAIVKNWDKIKDGARAVKDFIVDKFNAVVDFLKGIPGKISSLASGMFDGIKNAFKSAVNFIIRGWNSLRFGIPEIDTHIPGIGKIGGGSFGVPQIPLLAKGGTARAGMAHIVGEEGPELFVPGRTGQVVPNGEFGGGDTTVEIYGNGDPSVLEALIDRVVVKRNRATKMAVQAGSRRAFA